MRKNTRVLLLTFILMTGLIITSNAEENLKLKYNDIDVLINSRWGSPYINAEGITMVPLEGFMQHYGTVIKDIAESDHILIEKGSNEMEFIPNATYFNKNGFKIQLGTKAILKNDLIYVPLRRLMEVLGNQVSWDRSSKTVWIKSRPEVVQALREELNQRPDVVFETKVIDKKIEFVWPNPSGVDLYNVYLVTEQETLQKLNGLVFPQDSSHYRAGYYDGSGFDYGSVLNFRVSSVVDGVESELGSVHEVYLNH